MKLTVLRPRPLILPGAEFEATVPERMIWTSSSVKLFRKDKRKWFWRYLMRLRSRYRDHNLVIGTAAHSCWGTYYRYRRCSMKLIADSQAKVMSQIAKEQSSYFDQDDLDKLHTIIETFRGMMIAYDQMYKKDRYKWSFVNRSIEAKFKVDMGDFDYAGMIDFVASKSGISFLMEHKTASSIPESYIDRLPLDTQVRGYIFGATQGLELKVNRVLYDVVKKCKLRRKTNETQDQFNQRIAKDYTSRPGFYFFREMLRFNKTDIEAFQYEVRQTHAEYQRIINECKTSKGKAVDGRAILAATDPNSWTPNDTVCNDFFRICEYQNLCTQGLDKGLSHMFDRSDSLNDELADED